MYHFRSYTKKIELDLARPSLEQLAYLVFPKIELKKHVK